ncbi:uncharacterized protein LOC112572339 isoform X3 [Pomacea canaliculata]|uniref:uncharacterized protein LOC112572339 isoform X3 n=1 Tax=Pomacea canaliculata TaxID=400727 RepID=UPI000D736D13|nr:uncharacterized protein LOC112572339 isoform X3 [Pomacea canaliculata]
MSTTVLMVKIKNFFGRPCKDLDFVLNNLFQMLRLVFVTGIVLTTTAAQSEEQNAFNTRVYVTPPRGIVGETLTLECEGFLDLSASDYFIPGMKYEGTKRLSMFRRLWNGSTIEVAEMTADYKNPHLLDSDFQDARVWSFYHKMRVQQLKVVLPDVGCQFTGAYWCESAIWVNGGIVQHKSQPREFTIHDCDTKDMIRTGVYPILALDPRLMSLTKVGATLKLKCSLDINRPIHKERISRYAITFYGEVIASMTTKNKITFSDRYTARKVKVKGKATSYPPYLEVTLKDLRCTDLGSFRCTVWALDEFHDVVTVSDHKELLHTDNRDLKSLALQCPLHVDKSPNVLKPHLPFTLTCSAVVGLTSVRAIPNVESITMRRSTLEVKDVVVATMNETGSTALTGVPGETAHGIILSAYVVSLRYSVPHAGCHHVGVYWCSVVMDNKTREGPRNFIGFPCHSSKLNGSGGGSNDGPGGGSTERPGRDVDGPGGGSNDGPGGGSNDGPGGGSTERPGRDLDGSGGGSKNDSEGPRKVLELRLSVDMVSEAETKNVLEIQCVVPASDIKQLDKAEVYLNNQEIISTEGGRVMTARDSFYKEESTRTEITLRHLPTGAWVGLDITITPFTCHLAGLFLCKLQVTTKDNKTLLLNGTKWNTLPLPENLKEINTQKFSNTVNCSGVLEPPYNAFKLLHRDTSGSWVEKSNILSKRTSLDRISNCWLKGYEIFTLKNSQDKTWKCATHFQKS